MNDFFLDVRVNLTGAQEFSDEKQRICMVFFGGTFHSTYGDGEILPGGTDTQHFGQDGSGTLSARYMMRGKTEDGREFHFFVQNDAVVTQGEETVTTPQVFTDLTEAKWLESAKLTGTLQGAGEGQLVIRIVCAK